LTRGRYPAATDSEPPHGLALDEPFALPANVLVEQHSAELLEAGRGILQRTEDPYPVADLQRHDPRLPVVGALEPFRRVDQFGVAEHAGELQDEPSRDQEAGEVDGGQGALLSSSKGS